MTKEEARAVNDGVNDSVNEELDDDATAPQDTAPDAPEASSDVSETKAEDLAENLEENLEEIKAESEGALATKLNEYLEGWQRTRAEFANYKKRTDREMKESHRRGSMDALAKLLPIIDDFERAVQNIPEDLKDNPWVTGTILALPKLQKLLTEFDIEEMDPVGEVFDPNKHEAIGMDESDEVESGHVTVTLQKGYMSGDRVLRPALVRVAN